MEVRMPITRLHAGTAWGVVAEVTLAGVLWVWSVHPDVAAHTALGATASVAIVVVAMGATVVAVAITRSDGERPHRRAVTLLVDTLAAGLAALAVTGLFGPGDADGGVWFLMLAAAIGMSAVSSQVGRQSATRESGDGTAEDPNQQ